MSYTRASDERWIEYEIGHLLKQVRLEAGLSLEHVSERIEMDHVSVYGWEKGIYFPATLARFGLWCGVFRLKADLVIKKKDKSVLYSREL